MFNIKRFKPKMDSYDEVHDVKNERDIATPPGNLDELERNGGGSSVIQFTHSEEDEEEVKEDRKESLNVAAMDPLASRPKLDKVESTQKLKKQFRKLNIDSIDDNNNNSSDSSSKSDDDDDDEDEERHQYLKSHDSDLEKQHLPPPMKFEYNWKQFDNLDSNFPVELKEIMQFVPKYTPQNIDIDYKLQVFIPEFIPSVGDSDAQLKIITPQPLKSFDKAQLNDLNRLGLNVLDEPSEQSEEALLQIKLRSIFAKPLAAPSAIVKSPKDFDKWINACGSLHTGRIHDNFLQQQQTQINIDNLMSEWPISIEKKIEACSLPSPHLNCTLSEYVLIMSNLFDIPIENVENHYDYIKALNVLFNLYIAIRNEK